MPFNADTSTASTTETTATPSSATPVQSRRERSGPALRLRDAFSMLLGKGGGTGEEEDEEDEDGETDEDVGEMGREVRVKREEQGEEQGKDDDDDAPVVVKEVKLENNNDSAATPRAKVEETQAWAAQLQDAIAYDPPEDSETQVIDDEDDELAASIQQQQPPLPYVGPQPNPPTPKGQPLSHIAPPPLLFPPSRYHIHPQPPISERQFLKHVEEVYGPDATSGGSNAELDLTSFTIYAESDLRDGMLTLDQIATRQGRAVFLFDGFLDLAGTKHYLSHVPFSFVSIGGYEDLDTHAVDDALWIQSVACERGDSSGLWYRLDKPSKAYQEHHRLFTWVAGLAKHFLDYLAHHTNVALDAFRADFARWIDSVHGPHPEYQAWRSKHPAHDFRHAVVAHADFLQKQALDMDAQADDVLMTSVAGLGGYQDHLLWHQIVPSQTPNLVMPEQPQRARGTVVTPYVRECFKEMEWGSFLHAREPREEIAEAQRRRIQAMGFNMRDPAGGLYRPYADVEHKCGEYNGIRVGDVVAVPRDVETKWKGNEDDLWFALVTEIRPLKYTARLFVLWLYKPSDTLCAHLTYLPKRELFLSNHCNCDSGSLYASEVVRKVDVAFYSVQPPKGKEDEGYFVRQTYFSDDGSFATLEEPDFICPCKKEKSPAQEEADEIAQYAVGDTVLVERITDASDLVLEPAEILTIDGASFTLRPLRRRSLYDGTARPNELLYTYDPLDVQEVNVEQVDRKCHVRAFTPTQPIPAPYDRDGTGDFFYVRAALRDGGIVPLDPGHHVTFKQGYMLEQTPADKKLRALNIFCGGGTFDRGLEEGGAVQSEWAVEWDVPAMLTYLANHNSKDERHPVKCFCGSVDDYLHQAQDGASSTRDLVARCGEVDFISAGSPCQGYSTANQHKKNERSLRNSSMIASVASYVDFYRPKYAILENVVSMSNSSHERNPLAQLVCAFVGMGYQLRILNLDAWSFGAPQSRSRLFVLIAAPRLELPHRPKNSHSHPPGKNARSLGRGPSGLPFGSRFWEPPVFKYVSAREATRDLPDVGMARVPQISWPDHRTARIESIKYQEVINAVPKWPREQGLKAAVEQGRLRMEHAGVNPRKMQRAVNRSWTRIDPDGLIPTVTTTLNPFCNFTGKWVHWDQDRLMTVQEARRAQGYPDHEVLIGNPMKQWKIVGNSVARQVALVLGIKIREACEKSERDGFRVGMPVDAPIAPVLGPRKRKAVEEQEANAEPGAGPATPKKRLKEVNPDFSIVIDKSNPPKQRATPTMAPPEFTIPAPRVRANGSQITPLKPTPEHEREHERRRLTARPSSSSSANFEASLSLSAGAGPGFLSSVQINATAPAGGPHNGIDKGNGNGTLISTPEEEEEEWAINLNITRRKRSLDARRTGNGAPEVVEIDDDDDDREKENEMSPRNVAKRLRLEQRRMQGEDEMEVQIVERRAVN